MEDQNVVILLDKFKKLLELGNVPKVITEMDTVILMLEKQLLKSKGSRFQSLHVPDVDSISHPDAEFHTDTRRKINEIIKFLNERFPVN